MDFICHASDKTDGLSFDKVKKNNKTTITSKMFMLLVVVKNKGN